jgi:hypothetical protein
MIRCQGKNEDFPFHLKDVPIYSHQSNVKKAPEGPSSVLIRSFLMENTKLFFVFADINTIRTCDVRVFAPSALREMRFCPGTYRKSRVAHPLHFEVIARIDGSQ